jgi:eukaryotic-like serine/threonine-protein kinase
VLAPKQIFAGRYRIVRHIADGGMGAVFEAEHVSTEARIALKLLLPHVVHLPHARRRFELEAKVAARVNSEHIVKVFDAGLDERTRSPFLAMELLMGQTLAAHVKRSGPLPSGEVLTLMRQVARGLDAAHDYRTPGGVAQPIVHRDLKPENLFLAEQGDGTTLVKILDYGIAKVLSSTTEVSQEVRGTPLYMAFEQAAGEALSPQTDIWAFGLITYFALTGRHYWPAANKATGSTQALFAEILTLPLPLPSRRLREDGCPIVLPSAFDAWLLRCIDRNPTRRFGSAGQAVEALAHALEGADDLRAAAPRDGRVLRSPPTATLDLPPSVGAASQSIASVAGVASERRPTLARSSAARIVMSSFAIAAVSLSVLGAAWRWSLSRAGESGGAPAAPNTAAFDLRPAARAKPPPNPHLTPPPTPRAASQPESGSPELEPRVGVRAIEAAPSSRVESGARSRPVRSSASTPATRAPGDRLKESRNRATPPSPPSTVKREQEGASANANDTARSESGPKAPVRRGDAQPPSRHDSDAARALPEGEPACTRFDPYTGRCAPEATAP